MAQSVRIRGQVPWVMASILVVGLGACDGRRSRSAPDLAVRDPVPGSVTITSEPASAAVYRDRHVRLGRTPLSLTFTDGTLLQLTLIKNGYEPHSFTVMIEGGHQKRVHEVMGRAMGFLLVRTGPIRGAQILVDGTYRGRTPDKVEVSVGQEHALEVNKDGFHPYRERVAVQPGITTEVNALLLPSRLSRAPMGWLSVTSDQPASAVLNGKPLAPLPIERIPLPVRRHQLRVEPLGVGVEPKTLDIVIIEHELTRVHVNLGGGAGPDAGPLKEEPDARGTTAVP